jgi:hypothetical protein
LRVVAPDGSYLDADCLEERYPAEDYPAEHSAPVGLVEADSAEAGHSVALEASGRWASVDYLALSPDGSSEE